MHVSGLWIYYGPASHSLTSFRWGYVGGLGLWGRLRFRRGFGLWCWFRRWFLCGGFTGFLSEDNGGRPQSEEK